MAEGKASCSGGEARGMRVAAATGREGRSAGHAEEALMAGSGRSDGTASGSSLAPLALQLCSVVQKQRREREEEERERREVNVFDL